MKIQPITAKTNNYYQSHTIKHNQPNNDLSFKANLNIDNKLYSLYKSPIFKDALQKFKTMLKSETTFPSDNVKLFECPFYLAERTGNIKVTPRAQQGIHRMSDEGYCPNRTHYFEPIKYTYYRTEERANIGMSLNDKAEIGFYYDERRTADELANDFFNTYKHLRYQSHYSDRNDTIYERRCAAPQGYKVTWFNRFDQPVRETYAFNVGSHIEHRTTMYKYADDGKIVDIQYSNQLRADV